MGEINKKILKNM